MKLLRQYISSAVLSSTLLVLLAFTGLQIFINFMSELPSIGNGEYHVGQALIYVLLTTPYQTYQLFPMIGLLGGMLGLGMLAHHHELMVMRASGISRLQIIGAVMKAAFVMMLIMTLIGECVGPALEHFANTTREVAENNGQALVTEQGLWVKQNDEFIHIRDVESPTHLDDISIYRFNATHQLVNAIHARYALLQQKHWKLHGIQQSLFVNHHVQSHTQAQMDWQINIDSRMFNIGLESPDELSLNALWQYMQYRNTHGLRGEGYGLSFWRRIFQPLTTLLMMFLAVPFVLGSLRQVTMGLRIFIGVIVGISFYLINTLLSQLSVVIHMPSPLAVFLPILIFLFLGMYLMYRNRV